MPLVPAGRYGHEACKVAAPANVRPRHDDRTVTWMGFLRLAVRHGRARRLSATRAISLDPHLGGYGTHIRAGSAGRKWQLRRDGPCGDRTKSAVPAFSPGRWVARYDTRGLARPRRARLSLTVPIGAGYQSPCRADLKAERLNNALSARRNGGWRLDPPDDWHHLFRSAKEPSSLTDRAIELGNGDRWYVVHTLPHQESRAEVQLTNQQYRAFLPKREKTVRHARKLRTVVAPFFLATCLLSLISSATNGARSMALEASLISLCKGTVRSRFRLGLWRPLWLQPARMDY